MLQEVGLLQTILLSDEGYIIDFATAPAQIIFHAILVLALFYVIGRLLIKPMQNMLQKRQDTINQSISDAEENQRSAAELKAEYEKKLAEAVKEREQILAEAYKAAQRKETVILEEAHAEADRIRERAERDIAQEKEKAKDQIKSEAVILATAMTNKLLEKVVDAEVRTKLIEDAVRGMEEADWQM